MIPSPNRVVAIVILIALALGVAVRATAGGPAFIAAGPAAAASGVNGYYAGPLGAPGQESWWCQVIATPALAGSLSWELGSIGSPVIVTVRHAYSGLAMRLEFAPDGSLSVSRDGEQVARLDTMARGADGVLLPDAATGFRALAMDPCWMMISSTARDPRLGEALLTGTPTADCIQSCSSSSPVGAECTSPLISLSCCISIVLNNYCVADCNCSTAVNPTECRANAEVRRTSGIVDCVASFSQAE